MLTVFFVISCAKVVSPSGGPKDTKPPQVVKSLPENLSTCFDSKTATITFNEFIQLRDISNQFMISPLTKQMPEVKIKKKSIVVHFLDPLNPNTTYAIHFGNAIADITEGNVVNDYQYVFSTGDYVDSLKIGGKAFFAKNLKTEKGILVMLYSNLQDSVPYKEKPFYFSRTDDAGNFKITHIKSGEYKMFALKDANNNYLYDQPNESIAFLDTLTLDSAKQDTSLRLLLFEEPNTKQYVAKASCDSFGKAVIVFNKPTKKISTRQLFSSASKKAWELKEFSKDNTVLTYWTTDESVDTLKLEVTDNNAIIDTVKIPLIKKEKALKQRFVLTANSNITSIFNINTSAEITFSHPIKEFDLKKIILKEDSIKLEMDKDYFVHADYNNDVLRKFSIKKNKSDTSTWKENTSYQILIPPKAFTDIFDLTNDTLKYTFKTKSKNQYGTLLLKLKVPEDDSSSYILQLMDGGENVLKEDLFTANEKKRITYNYLAPTSFKLKLIYDTNRNGKWDTGNYLYKSDDLQQKQQPEKVIYYPAPIAIRADWDVEIEWDLTKK